MVSPMVPKLTQTRRRFLGGAAVTLSLPSDPRGLIRRTPRPERASVPVTPLRGGNDGQSWPAWVVLAVEPASSTRFEETADGCPCGHVAAPAGTDRRRPLPGQYRRGRLRHWRRSLHVGRVRRCGSDGPVLRSGFIPGAIGVLLAIDGVAYLAYGFADILAPGFADRLVPWIQLPALIGEGALCLWLLVVGVDAGRWKARTSAAARMRAAQWETLA